MKKLVARSYVESIDKDDEGVLEVAVASDSIVDRHGEIVSQEGWELKNFKKNPQLLWGHNSNELPIGKVKKIWFEGEGKKKDKVVVEINSEVTSYFKRKQMLSGQKIIKEKKNGDIVIEFEVSNERDLFHQLIIWLPNFKILQPEAYSSYIRKELAKAII